MTGLNQTPRGEATAQEFRRLTQRLYELVGKLNSAAEIAGDDEVWSVMDALDREGQRLFAEVLAPGESSARARLLAYLYKRPRMWVSGSTLRRVAGITAWQRRIRELRLDHGWRIESGGTSYRLLTPTSDSTAQMRHKSRARRGSD